MGAEGLSGGGGPTDLSDLVTAPSLTAGGPPLSPCPLHARERLAC